MHIRKIVLFAMLSCMALGAQAQAPAKSTPEAAVTEYMAAIKNEGITVASRYMHPDELTRFKDMLMPLFRKEASAKERPMTTAMFGPDATLEKIQALPGAEFMTALFKLVGDQLEGVNFDSVEILGSLPEGEVIHVVTRVKVSMKQITMRQMEVVSLKQHEGRWKLMLSGQFEGLASALGGQ
jgi:hypothetical protein